VTNEEMITILMRAYYYITGETENIEEVNVEKLENAEEYAKDKIKAAYVKGIIQAVGDSDIRPKAKVNRQEAAKMLIRFLNAID
jgi:hypothetical protein